MPREVLRIANGSGFYGDRLSAAREMVDDTIELSQEGPDRVRVSGVKGEPPPPETKLCLNYLGGYRNSMTFVLLKQLLPEARGLSVERRPLPNLLALNFVITGLLGEGVSSSTRSDPQAKSLGEYLRARVMEIPETLLA